MKKIELVPCPKAGSFQDEFEIIAYDQLGLRAGVLAIHTNGFRYANRNVQWLWRQFLRASNAKEE